MRRLGIVAGVLGGVTGGVGTYFLVRDTLTSAPKGLLPEPIWVDYAVASLLPVIGFLIPWTAIRVLVWIWSGFSEQP